MNLQKSGALSDLELLEIEMDLLWGSKAGPELVLARTRNGVRARIAERVPSEVARALGAEIDDNVSQVRTWRLRHRNWNAAAWCWRTGLVRRVRLTPGSGPSYLLESRVS